MANIKISELDELQEVADQDLFVIVDSDENTTKKIQAGNLNIKGGDTLPIGAMVEYNGTTVPQGYEKVSDNNIIESGSNENGNWVKFSDGTMIWTGSITIQTIEINNSFGSLYRTAGNTYGNIDFGVTFISTPKIFASLSGNYNCWLSSVGKNASSTKTGHIMLVNPTNETIWDETITYLAIGKWK